MIVNKVITFSKAFKYRTAKIIYETNEQNDVLDTIKGFKSKSAMLQLEIDTKAEVIEEIEEKRN